QPERVVLRIYGDSIILAPFDRHTRQILPEYTVLRRTIRAITLREERIGPLTVARWIPPLARAASIFTYNGRGGVPRTCLSGRSSQPLALTALVVWDPARCAI